MLIRSSCVFIIGSNGNVIPIFVLRLSSDFLYFHFGIFCGEGFLVWEKEIGAARSWKFLKFLGEICSGT